MIKWLRRLIGGSQATEWAVSTGNDNGQPVVVRTRTRAPQGMSSDRYPASVEIVWRFEGDRGGMPGAELVALMTECEDLLGTLELPANGFLGIAITGAGRREWVWYVADAEAFALRIRDLVGASGGRFPLEVRSTAASG
jgi:hypothetical protein